MSKKYTIEQYANLVHYDYPQSYSDEKNGKYEVIITYLTIDSNGKTLNEIIENRYFARNLFDLKCIVSDQLIMREFETYTGSYFHWYASDWKVNNLKKKDLIDNQDNWGESINYFARKSHDDWIIDETGTKRIGHYTRMNIRYIGK